MNSPALLERAPIPPNLSEIKDEDYAKYMSGNHIFGDDFTKDEIEKWFDDEKNASYQNYIGKDTSQYDVLNNIHAYNYITSRSFSRCLAIGVADGKDVEPISPVISNFYCIEPDKRWWKNDIGGKKSIYKYPNSDGKIDYFDDNYFDLAVAIGCLHHIPNVSFVINEIGKKCTSGGLFILREPIVAMGDWRRPRPNMTSRERGLPLDPLLTALDNAGFNIKKKVYFDCPLILRLFQAIKIKPYNHSITVLIDQFMCSLLKWNMHYTPKNIFQKIAPSSIFIIAEKR